MVQNDEVDFDIEEEEPTEEEKRILEECCSDTEDDLIPWSEAKKILSGNNLDCDGEDV